MQLSAEDYQCVLDSVRPIGAKRSSDRRLHARVSVDAGVTIIPLNVQGPAQPVSVTVMDVSRHGLRFKYDQALGIDQQFILCLTLLNLKTTRAVVCTVRRVSLGNDKLFEIGCEFSGNLQPEVPTDQVLAGLKKFQAALFKADMEAA